MTKLNYNVNLNKNNEESKINKSLNALSKQSVINSSLANRMPINNVVTNQTPIQTKGFGRTM